MLGKLQFPTFPLPCLPIANADLIIIQPECLLNIAHENHCNISISTLAGIVDAMDEDEQEEEKKGRRN